MLPIGDSIPTPTADNTEHVSPIGCKKERGFVRAVLRSSSEPMVNGLQLLLVMWPGGDCCYEKVGGVNVCFCAL